MSPARDERVATLRRPFPIRPAESVRPTAPASVYLVGSGRLDGVTRRRSSARANTERPERYAPNGSRGMALTNFVMTAAAIAVVASLMRHDVRSSTSMLRRNMRQMRSWMEEAAADVKPGEQTKLPGADKKPPHKDPSA